MGDFGCGLEPSGFEKRKEAMGPKLVIVMVGLPARGKSYVSKKLARYLNWLQLETRVFNAGQTRRRSPVSQSEEDTRSNAYLNHPAEFFDPDDADAVTRRDEIALRTLDDLLSWLQQARSSVGILDATNSTVQRRKAVSHRIRTKAGPNVELLFLESCCYDQDLLEKNVQLKLSGPDYRQHEAESALADFRRRIELYERKYTSMDQSEDEREFPYLQLIDVGRRVIANCINGPLSVQATEYLLSLRLHERQIWITRNGESHDDVQGKIGRSSSLSPKGARFASALSSFIKEQRHVWEVTKSGHQECHANPRIENGTAVRFHTLNQQVARPGFQVWSSIMAQAIETSQFFDEDEYKVRNLRMLNDLHAGKMEGLTFADIYRLHGEEMAMRQQNEVYYRWPGSGGESYADVIHRLRPIIMELERVEDHVLLITHRAVARVLLAYFQELNWEAITEVEVPRGRVFCVEPRPYGVTVATYYYDEDTGHFKHIRQV
ncbi:6-phosphofructo-2-kinase [Exophiala xenobiotica]|nr:6-phosphofructo-2-kinase [Exophiala xenobiotica]KAK5398897.1 6-phosphofructo-2-kinase [Exophiala xenobiotica]KAK5421549.1 6-phosphofructo-2-kinase [Exophiala xenobiotica]KAK5465800.1 6-phosphofructo-2-kinase [Exophiala xenobiotica]KAK5478736.1 6-phosphofructo-2-kinase [Exophiala xenobiotica]